jgi:hypothetical protein
MARLAAIWVAQCQILPLYRFTTLPFSKKATIVPYLCKKQGRYETFF